MSVAGHDPGEVMARKLLRPLRFLVERRHLIRALVLHDLRERFAGHMLGSVWHLLHPLILVTIYIMVFSYLFRARLGDGFADRDYITYAFSGLIPWLVIQEGLVRSANSIVAQPYLARQADFPLEVMPIKAAIGIVPTLLMLTLSFIGFSITRGVTIPPTILLLPLYWLLVLAFLAGAGYILGTLVVFVPDIRDLLQVTLAVGLFLSPILYLPGLVLPKWLDLVFVANPFSYVIWPHKDLVFYGSVAAPWAWFVLVVLDLVLLYVGVKLFRRMKAQFGDAL